MVKKININYKELQNMSPSEYFKKYNIVDKAEKRKIYREAKKLKEQSNPKEKIVNKEKEIKTEKIEIDNSTQNDSKSQINKSGFEVGKIESSEEAQSISNIFKGIDSEGNATNENQTSSNDSSSTFYDVNDESSDSSSNSSSSSKNKYADEQAIDVEGLAKIVPSTLNLVFKKYGVKELSEEESENMKEKSKVVIAKRAPEFITKYYDLIDLGIVTGPIVLDRVGQYQDIYKKVQEKKKQDEQAKVREAEQKAQAQQQANQQASQPKPASVAHKPSTSERINPNSPYYDFEYFKKWQKYAMGEGPKPEED